MAVFSTIKFFLVLVLFYLSISSVQATYLQGSPSNAQEIDTIALIDEEISPSWVFHKRSTQDWLSDYPNAQIQKTPIKSLHNSSQVDTLVEVRTEKTTLRFYKNQYKDLLLEAKVDLEPLSIGDGFAMGMNKSDFMRSFAETEEGMEQNVVVVVMDTEETNYYFFTFEQNVLVTVRYEGIVD